MTLAQRELIAIGASIGGNCIPCLRHHMAEAINAGCTPEDIAQTIELAKMIKERPIKGMDRLADELLQREYEKRPAPTPKEESV